MRVNFVTQVFNTRTINALKSSKIDNVTKFTQEFVQIVCKFHLLIANGAPISIRYY